MQQDVGVELVKRPDGIDDRLLCPRALREVLLVEAADLGVALECGRDRCDPVVEQVELVRLEVHGADQEALEVCVEVHFRSPGRAGNRHARGRSRR